MTNEPSPRPWRVEKAADECRFWIVLNPDGVSIGMTWLESDAALIVAAVNERDRLRAALNEVCRRVSVALNCPRHETEAIDLLVHDLLGIKECARAAIGEETR